MFNAALTRIGVALQCRLVREEKGATAVEYGLIAGLIAVVLIGAITAVGVALEGQFLDIEDALTP